MKCKYFGMCGGCSSVNDDYALSLKKKQETLNNMFKDVCVVNDFVSNYYPYKYRNKLQLAFKELKGKTLIGFFEEGSTKVTNIDGCILNGDWSNVLISIIREYISRFKIRAYGEHGGILRYAHARCIQNKLQLTLCVTTDNFPGRDWLLKKLKENFTSVSFYLNINKRTDHVVFDKIFKFVGGEKYLTFNMCGVNVSIEPSAFLQVNLSMAEKIYKQAIGYLGIDSDTFVYDLFSGIGITSIMFGKIAKGVLAIEENKKAVSNAIYMSKINNVNNIKFVCGKCENNLDKLDQTNKSVMFVDPARMGLEKSLIDKIKEMNISNIVYMSCNPETALRDIKLLTNDNKYIVTDITPYDMFACTKHAELLINIKRV